MLLFFFLMIRRPPRSTLVRSAAASDVYKETDLGFFQFQPAETAKLASIVALTALLGGDRITSRPLRLAVSYTHLRAHETVLDLVCRLLLEKKKKIKKKKTYNKHNEYTRYMTHTHDLTPTTTVMPL